MKWYYTIFDLNMSVGQYDLCLMVQWFCFISERAFDIWKSYFQIIKWCYTVFHLSMTLSHCDLYFMVQWFCPVSERYSTDLFTLSARHNSGELCYPRFWQDTLQKTVQTQIRLLRGDRDSLISAFTVFATWIVQSSRVIYTIRRISMSLAIF